MAQEITLELTLDGHEKVESIHYIFPVKKGFNGIHAIK